MTHTEHVQPFAPTQLGDYLPPIHRFDQMDVFRDDLKSKDFITLSPRRRFKYLAEKLIIKILEAPDECFLLPAVLEYLDSINKAAVLDETLTFAHFEFWLNHFSEINESQNQLLRNKIMGKSIPRDAYQVFFPIGMGKTYKGTHYVAAHLSPDVDTMIASFWGWVDAFAARVGTGLHVWCLPGGAPESPVTTLFRQLFGSSSIEIMARRATTLTLSSMDLVSNLQFSKKHGAINISNLDHGSSERAVILIDEAGHYLGDWRRSDVEVVRQVVILFKACLRWFENNLHFQLIALFSKKTLTTKDLPGFIDAVFHQPISAFEWPSEFSENQRLHLENFLKKILNLPKGLRSTLTELNYALAKKNVSALEQFEAKIHVLATSGLFDASGKLKEDRSLIFQELEAIHRDLNQAIFEVRNWAERLDVSIEIKTDVLNIPSVTLSMHSDVDVIRGKMGDYGYLTVTTHEKDGKLYPVGVVWDRDVRLKNLGTVSFRDFSNFEEVKMASYFSVISVIDHHKSTLSTQSPALVILGDAQSCNVLVAEQALMINDRFSLLGRSPESFLEQNSVNNSKSLHLQERLLFRKLAAERHRGHWVDPGREYLEYLFFIHAILDDTDLLTKVSARDVLCVAELINRLKSLQLKQDVEIISLDDLPQDETFARAAAQRILQNQEMYSIYKKSFDFREQEIAENLKNCATHKESNFFSDTKAQNGCCQVGQAKLFPKSIGFFKKHENEIRQAWVEKAASTNAMRPELDLYLFMISTLPSAEDLFEGRHERFKHQDELWFWIPDTELAQNHLASFLSAFSQSPEMVENKLTLEIWDPSMAHIFGRHFISIDDVKVNQEDPKQPKAVLRFQAGTLNSRKAMVSPYLPKLLG
jgi:hypothetical protein